MILKATFYPNSGIPSIPKPLTQKSAQNFFRDLVIDTGYFGFRAPRSDETVKSRNRETIFYAHKKYQMQ